MNIQDSLEILLRWLEDNAEMESDILFCDNVDSAAMIPAVQAAIALAEYAKHGTANADGPVSVLDNDSQTTSGIDNSIDGGKALQIADHERKLVAVTHGQVIKDALNATSDFLDTDCVMDRLGISYEDAELRSSGAMELHNALIEWSQD
ncbi:DUF957 domain-containing protein [Klebsiella pneumoniae]|uniref:DUF957 domain-containing protein n=1 Tax=Klebsiella pneumoniae TaxID=573 RepID=UPI000E2DDBBC|nr:DUF957 domain-containing protein [Klebsiella pneumoniae]SXP66890.1 Enterobacterial protein of uncharacterised function (DUF957) [Klebsiella pneumoniae]